MNLAAWFAVEPKGCSGLPHEEEIEQHTGLNSGYTLPSLGAHLTHINIQSQSFIHQRAVYSTHAVKISPGTDRRR